MSDKKAKIRLNSLWAKLIMPIMALSIVLAFIFYGTIFLGGTISELEKNSLKMLSSTVSGRATYLEQQMNRVWANFDESVREVEATITKALQDYNRAYFLVDSYQMSDLAPTNNNNSVDDIGKNYEPIGSGYYRDYLTEYILKSVSNDIVKLLRQNQVTGAYLILEGNQSEINKEGLYFRRSSADISLKYSDLILVVAPSRATVDYCAEFGTKSNSMDKFLFDEQQGEELYAIYNKTFTNAKIAAQAYSDIIVNESFSKNYSYWSASYSFININSNIISYNVPLLVGNTVYGVMGVDITLNNIISMLSPVEIRGGSTNGAYLFSVREKGSDMLNGQFYSGILYNKLYSNKMQIGIMQNVDELCCRLEDGSAYNAQVYASIKSLNIYNNNTPYEDTLWELVAIVEKDELFSFSNALSANLLQDMVLSLTISAISALFISLYLSIPVKKLAAEVKNNQSLHKSLTVKTNIREIDELVAEIQSLAANVAESTSRLEQVIQTANVPIGAFEDRDESQKIFYTGRFFSLLEIPFETEGHSGYLDRETFYSLLSKADSHIYFDTSGGNESLYQIYGRWVRLNITRSNGSTLGVVSDITQEINEKKKLAYERDTDLLTELLNRRAIFEQADALFCKGNAPKLAATIVIDLDNLKHINDNYGHASGDKYIVTMAQILREFAPQESLCARLSGDEFAVLLYGLSDKEQARAFMNSIIERLQNTTVELDDAKTPIGASVGASWYPENGQTFHELLRKADFAMYCAKRSKTIKVAEFEEDTNI